jgi:hypothetical protein
MVTKNKQEITNNKVFSTPLSNCFLTDPCDPCCSTHDIDIFGVYTIGDDRSIIFKQGTHSTPRYLTCKNPEDLNNIICKVIITAAKHSHRYIVINPTHIHSFLSTQNGEKLFANPHVDLINTPYDSVKSLPKNVIICVHKEYPENIGRINCFNNTYSFSLFMPSMISVFEIVPTVFGTPIKLGNV